MVSPRFVTGSLHRHIAVMTSTAALGLMAIFLVDLADIYFLSLLGETELAAAIGYAGSILFLPRQSVSAFPLLWLHWWPEQPVLERCHPQSAI